ncbi:hypothetical protein GEMRC1_007965 [Eukaryota sp. GEM-RC1]
MEGSSVSSLDDVSDHVTPAMGRESPMLTYRKEVDCFTLTGVSPVIINSDSSTDMLLFRYHHDEFSLASIMAKQRTSRYELHEIFKVLNNYGVRDQIESLLCQLYRPF